MIQIAPFSSDDVLVATLTESLALRSGIAPVNANLIGKAAALHDVGKYKVPIQILCKTGSLSADEFNIIKTHTVWGGHMLKNLHGNFGIMARNICTWHHERYDKHGYWGKSIDELPPYIPMVSVCDVYVALTTNNRPYKDAWTHEQAMEHIESESGRQFCPKITGIFLALMADNPVLQQVA